MGGIRRHRHRHRRPQKDGPRGQGGGEPGRPRGAGYEDIARENAKFEEFYRRQGVCQDEEELGHMMEAFKRDLPASFRVTGFRSQVRTTHFEFILPLILHWFFLSSQAVAIRTIIESKYFKELAEVEIPEESAAEAGAGDAAPPVAKVEPKCLPWYPDRMAWQLNLTRRDIRRVEAYFKLHNFLISETESGVLIHFSQKYFFYFFFLL